MVHVDSGGAYSRGTAAALAALTTAIARQAAGDEGAPVIVKKITMSKTAAPKSKAANVRALAEYIAGPNAGGDGEKVQHRGALTLAGGTSHRGESSSRDARPVEAWALIARPL